MSDKLTEKQQKFLDTYWELLNVEFPSNTQRMLECARIAGYGSTSLSNILKGVHKEVINLSFQWAALHLPQALQGVIDVLSNPTKPGAKNLIAAATTIMDRGGLAKAEKLSVESDTHNAVLILPAKEVKTNNNEEDK